MSSNKKSSSSSSSSSNPIKTVEMGFERLISEIIKHEGMTSLMITFVCLIIVIVLSIIAYNKIFFSSSSSKSGGGKNSKSDLEARRQQYQDLLGHIRALEALRSERELLNRRVLRVVQSWQKRDENRTAAPGATSDIVDDLADQVRIMKREHQLLSMNCVAALGERDTAGVFRADPQNQVWQKALAQAEREVAKQRNMTQEEIDAEDEEDVRRVEEAFANKKKTQ